MAKRPRLSRPVAVKEVLQGILNPGDRQALFLRQQIRRVWDAVVPQPLHSHTRLVDVRRKELWVEVSDSAWGQELQFFRPKILQELEKSLGSAVIRDLRIRVGEGS